MLSFKQNTPQSHNFKRHHHKASYGITIHTFQVDQYSKAFWGNYCAFTWQDSWRGDMKSKRETDDDTQ